MDEVSMEKAIGEAAFAMKVQINMLHILYAIH